MSAGLLSVTARLSKLRAMTAAEVGHRLRYKGTIALERRRHGRGLLAAPDRLVEGLIPSIHRDGWRQRLVASRMTHRHRFFASVAAGDELRALFSTKYRAEFTATLEQAAAARAHRFAFFGQVFQYGGDIEWQQDPVSRRAWPPLFHADVPVHGGDTGYGDVKHVWELSRQQFLIDLGKSVFLTKSPDDAKAIQRLVRSWIAGNPYATGVNWACALEPAFRVFSWLWTYYLSLDALDDEFHLEWLEAIHDHGVFLERHLELYSSPYNHLIAEAAALYMTGACFPEFRASERWKRRGREILEQRLPQQFYADGGSVEQSTFYHHATVGFYLLAGLLARATGDDLSPAVWAAVERGLDFSLALSQPNGSTPTIGGADDGKPIRMEHLPFWDFRPYQAIGAVVFDRADFKHVAGRFHEDALWLLGPAGLERFQALDARLPRSTSASLRASGYQVLRSSWAADADYVCFDCGEQAAGMRSDGVPNSMHGHADCLSVIVWLRGRRVLADSGLFGYNCGGDWEAHFRETAAHSTATIDGRDQARHIRKMAWSHSYRATLEGESPDGELAWAIGSHDGFARGPHGVVHRRTVWLRPGSHLLIHDEFTGSGRHNIAVNFQFAPGRLELLPDGGALFDDEVDVVWIGHHAWQASSQCGGPAPGDGWIAPSLGIRTPAPRLTLSCTTEAPRTTLLTVVAARTGRDRRPAVVEAEGRAGRGRLLVIATGAGTDVVAGAGIAPDGTFDTDAPLAVCLVSPDGVVSGRRAGGSRLRIDEDAVRRLAPGARQLSPAGR